MPCCPQNTSGRKCSMVPSSRGWGSTRLGATARWHRSAELPTARRVVPGLVRCQRGPITHCPKLRVGAIAVHPPYSPSATTRIKMYCRRWARCANRSNVSRSTAEPRLAFPPEALRVLTSAFRGKICQMGLPSCPSYLRTIMRVLPSHKMIIVHASLSEAQGVVSERRLGPGAHDTVHQSCAPGNIDSQGPRR